MEKTYCRGCGAKLVVDKVSVGYNSETGEEIFNETRICPADQPFLGIFSPNYKIHDHWEMKSYGWYWKSKHTGTDTSGMI
jgi:hypothetical protein